MGRRFDENDFADIENLIPKKHITPIKNTAVDTSAVYLEFGEDKNLSFGRCQKMTSFTDLYDGLNNIE